MTLQIATAGVNVPRDNNWVLNPVSGLYERSTLLEGQRTNGWAKSDAIAVANGWAINNTGDTFGANAALAPDGTMAMSSLIESSASTGFHYFSKTLPATTDGTLQSAAMVLAAGARSWAVVFTVSKDGTNRTSYVNLLTGALGTVAAGHTIRVRDRSNGRFRIEVTWDIGAGATTPRCMFGFTTGNGVASYPGVDGTVAGYAWRGQFEADQPFCSSDIPTDTVAVTRSADNAQIALPASLTTPQAMTLYAKFIEQGSALITGTGVLAVGGSADASVFVLVTTGRYGIIHRRVADVSGLAGAAPGNIGQLTELCANVFGDGAVQISQALDGGAEAIGVKSAANALAGAWAANTLFIGQRGAGLSPGFNAFLSVKLARGVKSMAQMRAF
jgi:hypothetical protein